MYINLLVGFMMAFLITNTLIPYLIRLAQKKKLFDIPNKRKIHKYPTPTLGGIAFLISFWLVSISLFEAEHLLNMRFVFIGSLLLFLIGLSDDLIGTSPTARLAIQFFVGSLCFYAGFQLKGFYGLFGLGDLSTWINLPLTIFSIMLIINAYNFIDGINGLAGSLGLLAVLSFAALFWNSGLLDWCLTALIIAGSIMGFLKYNFGKATIFMGDNGSTFLGFIIAILFIKFVNIDYYNNCNDTALLIGISVVFIPVFDLIRVFFSRIFTGYSPLEPRKDYIHHFILEMGKSHIWACGFILIMHLLAFILGQYFIASYDITLALFFTVIIEFLIILLILGSLQLTAIKKMESKRQEVGLLE